MKCVIADVVETSFKFQSPVDITHVGLEWGDLVITLTSRGDMKGAIVKFSDTIGIRLLDEGDLLEFWPTCSSDKGWIFRISQNGWFDHEASRPGFMRDKNLGICEYFIASQNSCISILSGEAPSIEIFKI
ncbi:hypothetical protein V8J88_23935 [Massilia sp. W12]|uniref:hypothetical protein n=1 Tax=Massilia sp. W12 TaxID=3126507 RepID=UPI0030D3C4B7